MSCGPSQTTLWQLNMPVLVLGCRTTSTNNSVAALYNLQAALARTTDLDPSVPTIAFLITDASPHLQNDPDGITPTAQHELSYLMSSGLSYSDASDVFCTFKKTALAHFEGNLILNCVVYNTRGLRATEPCQKQLLYGSFAQMTGAMVMQPDSRDSFVLAQGLISVVQSLLGRLVGRRLRHQGEEGEVPQADQLQGFKLIDLAGITVDRTSEQEQPGTVAYGDADVIFNIAMERMVAGGDIRAV